ncbi:50S ribosomal protein L35ae [Candidatus Woesearchaeota archaeon]|nr:50S ribosomal protein L35ae [Candidatus Woesearchaeota archaeon]
MQGTIASFRGGRHTQYNNQMIVIVDGVDSKDEAQKLVGKTVTWTTSTDKKIKGQVRSAHGNKGAIRVLFETGMPGQSITTKVIIS